MSDPRSQHELDDEQFHSIGRAVSDPRRFAILQQIAATDMLACSALREHEVISAATISHHLKELSEAGLIQMERCGRTANISFCRPVWQAYCSRLAAL
jgi:ArsR family transcriptional regulator, arsenate/arsenite/antimonite-responsive transcriptional repressor